MFNAVRYLQNFSNFQNILNFHRHCILTLAYSHREPLLWRLQRRQEYCMRWIQREEWDKWNRTNWAKKNQRKLRLPTSRWAYWKFKFGGDLQLFPAYWVSECSYKYLRRNSGKIWLTNRTKRSNCKTKWRRQRIWYLKNTQIEEMLSIRISLEEQEDISGPCLGKLQLSKSFLHLIN